MKAIFVALALAASAFAQGVSIFAPAAGTTVQQGSTVSVGIQQLDSPAGTGAADASISISLQTCGTASCDSLPSDAIGAVLFTGVFDPRQNADKTAAFESFDVQVPASFALGPARLSVSLGASASDIATSTLVITA
ncbi:hypothetical protein C2E23DRAFT_890220 [Lenzites betulinus]|nr:hypothetical protein C2E23DRAFT_890220 [Lenzites betulinus]